MILDVKQLSHSFGEKEALTNLNFSIENNSIEIKETGIILTLKILKNIDNVLNEIINVFMNFFPEHNSYVNQLEPCLQ